MPERIFLPYGYADGALEIQLASVAIDDDLTPVHSILDSESHSIGLASERPWERAALDLRVDDPNNQLESTLLDGESPDDFVQLLILVRGSDSRFRRGVPLQASDGSWVGALELNREDLRGALDLEAVAVRKATGTETAGKAFRRGERIGSSERWRLHIDDKVPMPGGAIDGEWRDFAKDPLDALRSRQDCAWYLDLSRRERPRIFFNEGIEGLRATLEIAQNHGFPAHVRNALTHSLLQPVLIALATEAIAAAPEPVVDELTGWGRKLLLQMARLCDHASEEAIVEEWLSGWNAGDRAEIIADITTAVQRHLDLGKGVRNLITSLEARRNG